MRRFPIELEQFFTLDIHPDRDWIINTDGTSIQRIGLCGTRREHPSPECFIALAFWTLGVFAVFLTRARFNVKDDSAIQ